MTVPSADLAALATAYGVATEYWDWQGQHTTVSAETIGAVLTALGVDVSTPQATAQACSDLWLRSWRRTLPPCVVARESWTPWMPVHVPHGQEVRLEIVLEDGEVVAARQVDNWVPPRIVDGVETGEATFELPPNLPLGWHSLRAIVGAPGQEHTTTATLVVTPQRLELPPAVAHRRAWGLMTQVYQLRSANSYGVGDLADLADLATWGAADLGADWVLVNPLHAAQTTAPMEASPYLPTTRRFVNPLYVRVEDIPEVAYLPAAARADIAALATRAQTLNGADRIDRDAAWAVKRQALRIVFATARSARRQRAFEGFCEREGQGLVDFATWCALADVHGQPWSAWPEPLHRPDSPAVADFREEHADDIDFYRWLQWVVEEQLAATQRLAREAGMSVGIIHDLAVGVHPEGADAWGLADALARGISVGAPPDQFNQLGQNWSQPPWRPDRLAELGYAPYRDMLRTVLRDSGGIRVDHIIGLFRLWWVPDGGTAREGTYVTYDHEALIGILCLEAHRAGAVVIGEDLGVVQPFARDFMRERGILGTSILWFEWRDDSPLPPQDYRELCLASVTTHDLPPTAGYLELAHVALREQLGLLTRPVEVERESERMAIAKIAGALAAHGLPADPGDVAEFVESMHRYLALSPARLLGVSVPDLVGDRRAINQPGTDKEYPNWCLPLSGPDGSLVTLEQLTRSPAPRRIARWLR
ncbi:MAG: 4-alpha-glucanotransferase [Tetrasphaera sp.]|nr:4-alpha-glucanotransferase [Tetrasphaera sp.]